MLDTLQKMSGTTHRAFINSKSITRDMQRIWMKNEGKASIQMQLTEMPVITYNDMAFISERNSIVFRAGDSPIWNRNETILPMSWRLFKDTIIHPGHEYTLQTIPTLSSALDFDVRNNQPDFRKMLQKRMEQAFASEEAQSYYKEAYGYSDYDLERLDQDNYADAIMDIINQHIANQNGADDDDDDFDEGSYDYWDEAEENTEQAEATAAAAAKYNVSSQKIFAGKTIAPSDLMSQGGGVIHALDKELLMAYTEVRGDMERDTRCFAYRNGSLYSNDGVLFIEMLDQSDDLRALNNAAKDSDRRTFASDDVTMDEINMYGSYRITDDFIRFLATRDRWDFANGRFDDAMRRVLSN